MGATAPGLDDAWRRHQSLVIGGQRVELLNQGVKSGEFRSIDPMLFYVSVLGACDHLFNARYALQHFSGRDTVSDAVREKYIAHVVDVFVNGISARTGAGTSKRTGKSKRPS